MSLQSISKYMSNTKIISNKMKTKDDLNYKTLYTPQDSGEITLIKLPLSSLLFSLSYKSLITFKGGNELNELPKMKKFIRIYSTKNVIIQYKILMTLGFSADMEFRLYINGKDDTLNNKIVKNELMVNYENISSKKLIAGEYMIELLYLSKVRGECNMQLNDWDILSLNILILDNE